MELGRRYLEGHHTAGAGDPGTGRYGGGEGETKTTRGVEGTRFGNISLQKADAVKDRGKKGGTDGETKESIAEKNGLDGWEVGSWNLGPIMGDGWWVMTLMSKSDG